MRTRANCKDMSLKLALPSVLLVSALLMLCRQGEGNYGIAYGQTHEDSTASAKAFVAASRVLLHPRCMNCHPDGDRPLVGDQSRPHPMNIERVPDGMGVAGLLCTGCHQGKNLPGEHSPPGAPDWRLPAKAMPMVFQSKTPRQICEHLKDPSQNGGRNLDEILEHVREAPLVLWAWDPGDSREAPPVPHDQFMKFMRDWVTKGATCPEK